MAVTVNFDFPRVIRSAAPRRLVRSSDGDTTVIDQPIRMVSCDTPEKSGYAGKPEVSQPKLNRCRQRLQMCAPDPKRTSACRHLRREQQS